MEIVVSSTPTIKKRQLTRYRFPFADVGHDSAFAMGPFYEPGSKGFRSVLGTQIHTEYRLV